MQENTVTVTLPEMGESVTDGSITRWRKKPGDQVTAGEPLVDVTTDKVDVEVPATASGKLVRILADEGATVTVGSPLAEIDTAVTGEAGIDRTTQSEAAPPRITESSQVPTAVRSSATASAAEPAAITAQGDREVAFPQPTSYSDTPPLARRRAAEQGADGATTSTASAKPAEPKPAPVTDGTVTALRGPSAALVTHMEHSLTIPTATSFRTITVDVLDQRRRELNGALKKASKNEKISYTHLIAFAIARAAQALPNMTASFRRGESGPERVQRGAHLGLAVDVQRPDGTRMLVVPVIHDADKLSFAAFHAAYESLVEKARTNSLKQPDLAGATVTLTNPGGIGTTASVPRLMSGQGTIVAAGAIGYPPGLSPAQAEHGLSVSKVMTLTSTYDHRIIQGAESGEFLRRIDHLLAGSDGFYEGIFRDLALSFAETAKTIAAPATFAPQAAPARTDISAQRIDTDVARAAAAAMALVTRYRTHGVNVALLDPLSDEAPTDPALDPATLNLDGDIMAKLPASALRVYAQADTMADLLAKLRDIYCGTIAYNVEHLSNHEQRSWLRQQIERGTHREPLSSERKLEMLERLTRVEAFERYLRKAFLGQKTFSIEGLDAMIPMLEEMLDLLTEQDVKQVRIGMAHRGRLAVITHVVDRPYEDVLEEFEQAQARGLVYREGDVTGDVKYHQGATGTYATGDGKKIDVALANNPSHLEAVDSIVEGQTRAVQTDRHANLAKLDTTRAAPILIHGDAAFDGQGVVAEVLNLQSLEGYTTGGTLHIIANNQIGFTTLPSQGRSTRFASDLAKGFDVPIIHVNADDLEACIAAVHLAVAYRRQFQRDALIDLVGYRRFGHNEADEPAYTQPEMYERIAQHPTARDIFARKLVAEGTISEEEVQRSLERAQNRVAQAHAAIKARLASSVAETTQRPPDSVNGVTVETRVPALVLQRLNSELLQTPDGFAVHPKLIRQLQRRKDALEPDGEVDFGLAEALAFASLLREGVPIRVTGQDTERGTFSHRHLVLHDAKSGDAFIPMQHLSDAKASFEVYNSPLSEYACMGFEYGYSAIAPEALVLWEAQFGDFSNGGQIIIDQYISAGKAKWDETSRLTLLLPHGYEGAGPEHSSARLERFLQLAAEGNFRVANCTTPAQYFHLLRDQAKSARGRPLVIMTSKSLLRLHAASSRLSDLAEGGFAPVIDDPSVRVRSDVNRLILCSGKVYYDLVGHPQRQAMTHLAITRVELLEPFPFDEVLALVASYPRVRTVTWVQEEPKNMGARAFVSRRIREQLTPQGIAFDYVGRPDRAAPSEGYPGAHAAEQQRLVNEALGVGATARR